MNIYLVLHNVFKKRLEHINKIDQNITIQQSFYCYKTLKTIDWI